MESFDTHFLPEVKYEYNGKKALNQMSEIILGTTRTLESVFDHNWIHLLVENPLFFNILADFKIKQKGIAVRFMTTITPENISNCTKLMKFVELRHTDAIIGYLGISDRKQFFNYIQPISRQESNHNLQLNFIHIIDKDLIQMQYFFFEKLWESSIPANERIAEIKRMMFDNNLLNTKIRDLYTIKGLISLKDNDKNTFKDAIEMASFSNNELNVSTLLSFFDNLWIRTEIGKQNIIKQTYFKIKNLNLEMNYRRKWSFEHTTNE